MSYDIMIIDRHNRFKNCKDFLKWYDGVTQWNEAVDYDDYSHTTTRLKEWFLKMKDIVPPLNGAFAPSMDDFGKGRYQEADYCIANECIYVALAYSDVDEVKKLAFGLAKELSLSYYDVSGSNCLHSPDGRVLDITCQLQQREMLGNACRATYKHRAKIAGAAIVLIFLLSIACSFIFRPYIAAIIPIAVLWSMNLVRWVRRSAKDVVKAYKQMPAEGQDSGNADGQWQHDMLFDDILWNFHTGKYETIEEFRAALIDYNANITSKPIGNLLDARVESAGRNIDRIELDEFLEDAGVPSSAIKVRFTPDDGNSFTMLELLFKLNNELSPLLQDTDFIFFEGIRCYKSEDGTSVCQVSLGS